MHASMILTPKVLVGIAKTGALFSTEVRAVPHGFQVMISLTGSEPLPLMTVRGAIRTFKSWATCMRYLRSVGITRVMVDMEQWDFGETTIEE